MKRGSFLLWSLVPVALAALLGCQANNQAKDAQPSTYLRKLANLAIILPWHGKQSISN